MNSPSSGSSNVTAIKKAINLHQNGFLEKADKIYLRILKSKPNHAEALHMRGVLKLEQDEHRLAEHLLKKALQSSGNDPWVHYHLAQVLAETERHQSAIAQFKKAIHLGATEADVFFMYANSLFELKQLPDAISNYQKALQLEPTDQDCKLNLANAFEANGELQQAINSLEPIVISNVARTDLKLQLAELLVNAKQSLKAHSVLLQIKQITIADFDRVLATARHMHRNVRYESAAYLLNMIIPRIDSVQQYQFDLTIGILNDLMRYNESRELLNALDKSAERTAWSWFQQGICEQVAGEFEAAAKSHQTALSIDDTLGAAAYSLASNGSLTISDSQLSEWGRKKDDPDLPIDCQSQFSFAVARVFDSRKEFDRAFECYLKGNTLVASESPFDSEQWDQYTDNIIDTFTAEFFEQHRHQASPDMLRAELTGDNLLFIVGMPRSGSTLLEQILVRNTGATGLGEHHAMRRIIADIPEVTAFKRSAPECALDLEVQHIEAFRMEYLDTLPADQSQGVLQDQSSQHPSSIFVDKMLGNFVRLGVLALMFPKAKILHSCRNPMATGVSCFINAFNSGLRFTYNLNSMGRAWQSYHRLMVHWHNVLPLEIMDVHYEQLVSDTENYLPKLLQFVDASENQVAKSAVNPTDKNSIATASFWQARQPVSAASVESWQRFDKYLDPLREGLDYKRL